MGTDLNKNVRNIRTLEGAWAVIRRNGIRSPSANTRAEIKEFESVAGIGLRRIQRELRGNRFDFPASVGIPVNRGPEKERRPLVKSPIPARIVQRAIHDVLLSVPEIKAYAENPHSFGGVRRRDDDGRGAVPAAIAEVIKAIDAGATYYIRSDIQSFFRNVPRLRALSVIKELVSDQQFLTILDRATEVELLNIDNLKQRNFVHLFPTYELGVAQGNSLSPLIGNILLAEFDMIMNSGSGVCIRYIDDFLILAKTKQSARALFAQGVEFLSTMQLKVYPPGHPKANTGGIAEGFEFLGINLENGAIRPAKSSRKRLLDNIDKEIDTAILNFRELGTEKWRHDHSLTATLKAINGMVSGWGDQYSFCNERNVFKMLDEKLDLRVKRLLGVYGATKRTASTSLLRRRLLGISPLVDSKFAPLKWRTTANEESNHPSCV